VVFEVLAAVEVFDDCLIVLLLDFNIPDSASFPLGFLTSAFYSKANSSLILTPFLT
jgi:hypothetical protein